MNAGQLAATLSMNLQPFISGAQQAVKAVQKLGQEMQQAFGKNLKTPDTNKLKNDVDRTRNSVKGLGSDFKDLDRIVSGIVLSQVFYAGVGAIKDAISAVGTFSSEMERAGIAMEYFLGSTERAQGFILNMKDFAAETAFSTQQAIQLSKQLMGAQIKPEEVRGIMEILNDATSATGASKEQIDRVVLAITQMKTAGRLLGGELRQLTEAGIPAYQIIQEELGLTADQMARLGDLRIPADSAIAGLLKGLEKRYKGAADRLAETMAGMWDTIQDDSLFIGEALFAGVYEGTKNVVRNIRDTLEGARDALIHSGLGGVFEYLVPEGMQDTLRAIIGGFQQLGKAVSTLAKALKPAAELMLQFFGTGLAAILPVISGIVNGVANLANAVMQASPAIRILVASIMGLMVAQTAAKALMFLWSVTRLGGIAVAVGKAVQFLAKSIQFLSMVFTKSPWGRVIIIAGAALMYLASTSKVASAWLDQLMGRIAALGNVDIGKILQPEDAGTDIKKWTDDFNKQFGGINDNLKDTGKGLEDAGKKGSKAGKKIKDKFVASFDELYQVPDQLDKIGAGMDGLDGNMPSLDPGDIKFDIPDLGEPSNIPDVPSPWDGWQLPPIFPMLTDWLKNFSWADFPLPDFSPLLSMVAGVVAAFKGLQAAFGEMAGALSAALANALGSLGAFASNVGALLGSLGSSMIGAFAGMGTNIATALQGLQISINGMIVDLIGGMGSLFNGMNTLVTGIWVDMVGAITGIIQDLVINGLGAIVDWIPQTVEALNAGFVDIIGAFGSLADSINGIVLDIIGGLGSLAEGMNAQIVDIIGTFGTLADTGVTIMRTMAIDGWNAVVEMATNIGTTLTELGLNAQTLFEGMATQTVQTLGDWGTQLGTVVTTGMEGVQQVLEGWRNRAQTLFQEAANTIVTTVTTMGTNLVTATNNWITNVQAAYTKWSTSAQALFQTTTAAIATTITTWATNTATAISNWVTNTGKNFESWRTSVTTTITNWAKQAQTALTTWAQGAMKGLSTFITNSSKNFGSWATSVYESVKSGASSAGKAMADWLNGMGQGIATFVNTSSANLAKWGNSVATIFGTFASSAWGTMQNFFNGLGKGAVSWANNFVSTIVSGLKTAWDWIGKMAEAAGESLGVYTAVAGKTISNTANAIGNWVADNKTAVITGAAVTSAVVAAVALAPYTGGWSLAPLLGLETGGIVDEEQIIRIGEGDRREAVIPLQNSTYMKPFSAAVANDLASMLGSLPATGTGGDSRPQVYIWNYIGDDRSLKELERRLEVIRVDEDTRRGR